LRAVVMRVASGPQVGMGHAMRSRAVAQALARRGADVTLVFDEADTARLMRAGGWETFAHEEHPDWAERPWTGAWLDGFRTWAPEVAALRAAGVPIALVENRRADRDAAARVVYPCLHYRADAWDRAHPRRVLHGAPWIPLARELVQRFHPREERERDVDLAITFGGADPGRSTERVLRALGGVLGGRSERVAVVLGPHMRARRAQIERAAAGLPGAELVAVDAPPFDWLARSRAALTAVGTTLYELAYLRVPAWILANYDADGAALEHYASFGPHRALGVAAQLTDAELASALASALDAPPRVPAPVAGLGGGAERLAELLAGDPETSRTPPAETLREP